MASTAIHVENKTEEIVQFQCWFAASHISQVTLGPGDKGDLPCEWVHYGVWAYLAETGKELALIRGVYANNTVKFQQKENGQFEFVY